MRFEASWFGDIVIIVVSAERECGEGDSVREFRDFWLAPELVVVVEEPVVLPEGLMSQGLRFHLLAAWLKESCVGSVPHSLDCGGGAVTFHQGRECGSEVGHCWFV